MLLTLQHLVRDEGVAGSNPATPTNNKPRFPDILPGSGNVLRVCMTEKLVSLTSAAR